MMSDAARVESIGISENQVAVKGRISYVQRHDGKYRTRVALPAADEFSFPGSVMILSDHSLGSVGDDLKVRAYLAGRSRQYASKDTGEMVQTADSWLVVR